MKQDSVKIATVSLASEDTENNNCYLKVTCFIGKAPVNEDYIKDGQGYRLFQSKGEAVDYASEQLQCDYIVVDNARERCGCQINALVGNNLFFKDAPLQYSLCT